MSYERRMMNIGMPLDRAMPGRVNEAFKLGHRDARHAAAEIAAEADRRLEAAQRLADALEKLLARDQRNTCQHEETYRGGAIWEICRGCGAKWADDEGGKPDWQDPQEWVNADDALAEWEATK